MFKCTDCGALLDKEFLTWDHDNSGSCGEPLQPSEYESCSCGGEWEEPFMCLECGEWFLEDEMREGICEECQEDLFTPELMLEFINSDEDYKKDFFVNWWTESDFDTYKIHDELLDICIDNFSQSYNSRFGEDKAVQRMEEYCKDDTDCYLEWVVNTKEKKL